MKSTRKDQEIKREVEQEEGALTIKQRGGQQEGKK